MENRLMTIVFIDMQGYTKRSATQTIEEMKLFHDQMFKFVSEIMEKWKGIMVKTMGDGFMIRFESPTNAVQAGIEIQRRLDARNAQMMNPDSIVRFRVGINTGEVGMDEAGDLFGDPVNIAARIQTFADSNDVFISEATYLAMNRNEFGSVDLGNQDLKNATREIKIYKVLKNGAPGVTIPMSRPAMAASSDDTARKKKIAMIAGGVFLILLTLFVGVRLGRRGRGVPEKQLPVSEQVSVAPEVKPEPAPAPEIRPDARPVKPEPAPEIRPDARPVKPVVPDGNRRGEKTFLDVDPGSRGLPFDDYERGVLAEVQKMRSRGDYNPAERKSAEMIYLAQDKKKIFWTLALAELFWEQKHYEKAEQVFTNLKNSPILEGQMKVKVGEFIQRIKDK